MWLYATIEAGNVLGGAKVKIIIIKGEMGMGNRKVLVMLCVFVLFSVLSAQAGLFDNLIKVTAERKAQAIEKMIQQRNWAGAEAASKNFVKYLKNIESRCPSVARHHGAVAYDKLADVQGKQGKYNTAANTIREKNIWRPSPGNVDLVMKYERYDNDQRDYYRKSLDYHNKTISLRRKILGVAREKEKLVKELLKNKSVTKEQLKELQDQIKKLNATIADYRKDQSAVWKEYYDGTAEYRKNQIALTKFQNLIINKHKIGHWDNTKIIQLTVDDFIEIE